jgi:hypothetical protein
MPTTKEQKLHTILAGFGLTTIALLKRHRFFDKPLEALSAEFWKRLRIASRAKNEVAFEQIFELYSKPALEDAAVKVSDMLNLAEPIETITSKTAWVDRYYEARRAKFVDVMTKTDFKNVRRLTSEEALTTFDLIDENRYVNERDFARMFKGSEICDGNLARIRKIDRFESHGAETGGSYNFATEVGAEEKHRLTAHDDRVREEHAMDEEVGWVPMDQEYPYSHEMYAGENDLGCRCSDMYRFKPAVKAPEET